MRFLAASIAFASTFMTIYLGLTASEFTPEQYATGVAAILLAAMMVLIMFAILQADIDFTIRIITSGIGLALILLTVAFALVNIEVGVNVDTPITIERSE